jgi:hypothetical protein
MPITQQFQYNSDNHPSVQWREKKPTATKIIATGGSLRVKVTVDGDMFTVSLPGISKYAPIPKISSEKVLDDWHRAPMAWWQTQVNYAIWAATAGCGVGMDHLQHKNGLVAAVYQFHVYYQVRRILAELKIALPNEVGFDPENNLYNVRAYERLCLAFGVDPRSQQQFRVQGANEGAGKNFYYVTRVGYQPAWPRGEAERYIPGHHSFTKATGGSILHIDYIYQDQTADDEWTRLIPAPGETAGFTLEGVQRLNDSIRTYVWAVLGAQGQTRTSISGAGSTKYDAQKQFAANVEDAINAPVDLPTAIGRYQNVLQYASSQVNFVIGAGLYMTPADMRLNVERGVMGYNNKILTAGANTELGLVDINASTTPIPPSDNFAGNTTKKVTDVSPVSLPAPVTREINSLVDDHSNEKVALIVAGTVLFAAGLYVLRGRLL